ncbi:MAG TPA: radical SAM protein [Candidatus Binataceae bacterium]|nr:radical SAM protein [Candidatus Binataceae bacterium]
MTRQYEARPVERALTPTGGFLSGFAFSLNPYIGCAFGDNGGCPFCYVRCLPVARARSQPWGQWVIAKENLAVRLAAELARIKSRGNLDRLTIFMSSATDPYQGLERQARLTRAALQLLQCNPPRRLMVQTRSPLVERDIDLLKALGTRVIVSLTLETDDEQVRRQLCPTSPSIARRVLTAQRLRAAGIFVQLAISPMLPNHPERLAAIAAMAADRVVVDTLRDGDGGGGRRSQALGMPDRLNQLGYAQWWREDAHAPLMAALRAAMGEERVGFSQTGFNAI